MIGKMIVFAVFSFVGKEVLPRGNNDIVWPLNSGFFYGQEFSFHTGEGMDYWDIVAKSIWKSRAPRKVCFFAWVASKGKIPTDDKLKRRNLSGPSRCFMCLEEEEYVDHLLVHCRWASSLWDLSLFNGG